MAHSAFHRDKAKFRSKYLPTIKQSPDRFEAGRCWVGDHAQLDFILRIKDRLVRAFVTTWMDWRTHKIVGWCLSPEPNTGTIMAAAKMAFSDESNMGGPAEVVIDNGRDYDSWTWSGQTKQQRLQRVLSKGYIDESSFKGVWGLLKVEAHYSIAYCPNGKSPMERWFRVMHDNFCKSFPTYCGSTPEQKPEGLADILERKPQLVPQLSHVRERFAQFVQGWNECSDHQMDHLIDDDTGQRLSSAEAMHRWCIEQRFIDPASLEAALRIWTPPQKVGKHGVAITVAGQRLEYGATEHALGPFKPGVRRKAKERRVLVSHNVDDLSSVRVYAMSDQGEALSLICVAPINQMGGMHGDIGRELVKDQLKRQRDYNKALKFVSENRELEYLTKYELIASASIEQQRPQQPAHAMQLVATALDAQGERVQQETERLAVGAEARSGRASTNGWLELAALMPRVEGPSPASASFWSDTLLLASLNDLADQAARMRGADPDDEESMLDMLACKPATDAPLNQKHDASEVDP